MNRTIMVLALMFTSMVGYAQQTQEQRAKLDAKHGIRDIKLGTLKSRYTDLYLIREENGCSKTYKRKNENLMIGEVKVSGIEYTYIDNVLYHIGIEFKSEERVSDFKKLVMLFTELYGEPTPNPDPIPDGEALIWYGKTLTVFADEVRTMASLQYLSDGFQIKCDAVKKRNLNKTKSQL